MAIRYVTESMDATEKYQPTILGHLIVWPGVILCLGALLFLIQSLGYAINGRPDVEQLRKELAEIEATLDNRPDTVLTNSDLWRRKTALETRIDSARSDLVNLPCFVLFFIIGPTLLAIAGRFCRKDSGSSRPAHGEVAP